jgi:hypothetical protein
VRQSGPVDTRPRARAREAAAVLRPALLSEQAVGAVVRAAAHPGVEGEAGDKLCAAVYAACGGNPLYLTELLRAADRGGRPLAALEPAELLAGGLDGIARQVITRAGVLAAQAPAAGGPADGRCRGSCIR